MEIKTLDKTVIIEIPKWAKKIGVMLSGGMDSALMLYLILKEIEINNINVSLTVFNVPNPRDNAEFYSFKIIEYLEKEFQKNINLYHIGNVNLPHNKIIQEPSKQVLKDNIVHVLYSGTNQNPPTDFSSLGPWRRKEKGNLRTEFPFIDLYKTHILEIYKQFNILELCYLTHSCTESKGNKCNQCFQCMERAWAFSSLGLIDESV